MNSPQEVIENFILWYTTDDNEREQLIATINDPMLNLIEISDEENEDDDERIANNIDNVIRWVNRNFPIGKEYLSLLRCVADYFEEDHVDGLESIGQYDPTEEELLDWKKNWGQTHEEICSNLGYDSDDDNSWEQIVIIGNYFWHEEDQKWYNNSGCSMMSDEEREIADWVQNKCS